MMEHYGGGLVPYPKKIIESVLIIKVEIEQVSGKQAGY
jgi:hypothetical protein